eukprot:5012723-Pleurochrysis_carterae.AAC.2
MTETFQKSAGPARIRRRHRTSRARTAGNVVLLRFLSSTPVPVQTVCSVAPLPGFSACSDCWLFLVEGYN